VGRAARFFPRNWGETSDCVRRVTGFPADLHAFSDGRLSQPEEVQIQCRPVLQPMVGPNSRGVRREPSVSVPYE